MRSSPFESTRDETDVMTLSELVDRIPRGWTEVTLHGRRWGLARTDHAGGRTVTIEAEDLGTGRRIGANVIRLSSGDLLRPCEIPEREVLDVLEGYEF